MVDLENICRKLFLSSLVIILTSCNAFTAKPAEMPIPTAIVLPTTTFVPEAPTLTPSVLVTFDRHNPESVLRGYFDAWGRNDWSAQKSFMDQKYAPMSPEPVDSIHILQIKVSGSSATEQNYQVLFEIRVKGQGISMYSGKYQWDYYLTWDASRDSWLITNYGAG